MSNFGHSSNRGISVPLRAIPDLRVLTTVGGVVSLNVGDLREDYHASIAYAFRLAFALKANVSTKDPRRGASLKTFVFRAKARV